MKVSPANDSRLDKDLPCLASQGRRSGKALLQNWGLLSTPEPSILLLPEGTQPGALHLPGTQHPAGMRHPANIQHPAGMWHPAGTLQLVTHSHPAPSQFSSYNPSLAASSHSPCTCCFSCHLWPFLKCLFLKKLLLLTIHRRSAKVFVTRSGRYKPSPCWVFRMPESRQELDRFCYAGSKQES